MSLKSILTSVLGHAHDLGDIYDTAVAYVQRIEAAAAQVGGKSGADKLAAVKEMLSQFVSVAYPALAPQFETMWPALTAFINGLVAGYNLIGFFAKVARA